MIYTPASGVRASPIKSSSEPQQKRYSSIYICARWSQHRSNSCLTIAFSTRTCPFRACVVFVMCVLLCVRVFELARHLNRPFRFQRAQSTPAGLKGCALNFLNNFKLLLKTCKHVQYTHTPTHGHPKPDPSSSTPAHTTIRILHHARSVESRCCTRVCVCFFSSAPIF